MMSSYHPGSPEELNEDGFPALSPPAAVSEMVFDDAERQPRQSLAAHKRRSLFSRNSSANAAVSNRRRPMNSYFEDPAEDEPTYVTEDAEHRRKSFFPRKRTSTLPSQQDPASSRFTRWARSDEDSRPKTADRDYENADSQSSSKSSDLRKLNADH